MAEYSYKALDKAGKEVRGAISASSEEIIIEKLRNLGYYPLEVGLTKKKVGDFDLFALPGIRVLAHRIRTKDVMTFTRQFATLLDAGLPILRALAILQEQVESVVLREKLCVIARDVEAGSTLSDAMAKHPKVFDNLYVNMVRAGELAGVLEAVLNKIAEFLERRQAIVGKVRSAMTYPAVVVFLASAIVGFILVSIVPRFKDIYAQLNAELPMPTQVLIRAGDILLHQGHWVVAVLILLMVGYKQVNRTRGGKFWIDSVKLRVLIFGPLFRKSAIVRFAGTLATLIRSGVPILQALDICRETSGNEVVSRAIGGVYESVREGETIHQPLADCRVFPPLVVHMVAVGEETGAVDDMLAKVAEAYEREIDDTVNALTSIIEPVLMVFLGVVVGAIVIALYLPLFYLSQIVGK